MPYHKQSLRTLRPNLPDDFRPLPGDYSKPQCHFHALSKQRNLHHHQSLVAEYLLDLPLEVFQRPVGDDEGIAFDISF